MTAISNNRGMAVGGQVTDSVGLEAMPVGEAADGLGDETDEPAVVSGRDSVVIVDEARSFLEGVNMQKGQPLGYKWLINPERELSPSERKNYWEGVHSRGSYDSVFAVTEDSALRGRILSAINKFSDIRTILVPGCGSRTFLQEDLVKQCGVERVACTDYEKVIRAAARHFNHSKLEYLSRDSRNLGFENEWDAVVIVNSILSESDVENREILFSCYKALRPGGSLIGYFPTIFCAADIDSVDPGVGMGQHVDLPTSSFYEQKQGVRQIFYTPLRLRCILKEAGFKLGNMEIHFFDSDFFAKQSAEYYGLRDEDTVVYELFVIASKRE